MPRWRTRLTVALVSLSALALELAMMRALSLRFWHHFAYMVISVALLGFGASGTALMLLRRAVHARPRGWMAALSAALALSVPLTHFAARHVGLDVQMLAWDRSQLAYVALVELLMFVPFFLAACVIGIALLDRPERTTGHYVANLLGSGAGAVAAVALMFVLTTGQLLMATAAAAYLAAAALVPWRRAAGVACGVAAAAAAAAAWWLAPYRPAMSQYKALPQLLAMPRTEVISRADGPLGRIDVVAGPAIHAAPGVSLAHMELPPPHVLILIDGEGAGAVYHCTRRDNWDFMDYTTSALPYHLRRPRSVLVIGAGGGADIGLARFHGTPRTVALEMNRQLIDLMTGPLADRGGGIYRADGVTVVNAEARGYLAASDETFDLIQFPAVDVFGASGGGLQAAQESYLYTIQAFDDMIDHLSPGGLLCISRPVQMPPRGGARVLDTAAEALRRRGLDPATHLAMIRSWISTTVVVSLRPFGPDDLQAAQAFCKERWFDLCHLPGLEASQTNIYHQYDRPYFYEAAQALLGPSREQYLADYLFDVEAATDDRPYFFHYFRLRGFRYLQEQLGRRSLAFLEMGYVMVVAALGQAVVAAGVLILLPLVPGLGGLRGTPRRAATVGYFLLLGAGFMLLEMGFLQKLVLYLAHPIYSAAVVITGFLVFAGLGSLLSRRWRERPARAASVAGAVVVALSLAYAFGLDAWVGLTQGQPIAVRFAIALATIAPLAVAMGHLFPTALRQVGAAAPRLVPWAWAANGFASVVATVAAPLLAMSYGFSGLTLVAIACYALAALLALALPRGGGRVP
jgi:hypothetical protein